MFAQLDPPLPFPPLGTIKSQITWFPPSLDLRVGMFLEAVQVHTAKKVAPEIAGAPLAGAQPDD